MASPIAHDFWLPVYEDSNGNIYSPGQVGDTFIDSDPWAVVYFGGNATPGIAEVSVHKGRSVDQKKPAGSDGERLTLHGMKAAEIEIRVTIWTPAQLDALKALWAKIMVPAYKMVTQTKTVHGFGTATTTATASAGNVSTTSVPTVKTQTTTTTTKVPVTFDVIHPQFTIHNIKAVQIIDGRGPEQGQYAHSKVFTIRAVEYLPPKNNGSATKTDDAPLSDSNNALTSSSYPMPSGNTNP